MAFQDAGLGLGEWRGNHLVDMHRSIFVEYSNWGVNILFLLGLLVCARRCVVSMRRGVADVSFVLVAYFLCNYLLLIGFLRLNWDRYYVPIEVAMRVIAAIGVAGLTVATLQPGLDALGKRRIRARAVFDKNDARASRVVSVAPRATTTTAT
jgi:hypothetical protein